MVQGIEKRPPLREAFSIRTFDDVGAANVGDEGGNPSTDSKARPGQPPSTSAWGFRQPLVLSRAMAEDFRHTDPAPDPILASMEQKYLFHRNMAERILRDIAEYKRLRSEYPEATSQTATTPPTPPTPIPTPPAAAPISPSRPEPALQAQPRMTGPSWRYEPFDGTFASLVRHYRTDSGSPYFKLQMKVRKDYDGAINKLMLELGPERIANFNAAKIQALYDGWKAGGKVATAHGNVGKVRLLASFGTTSLNDDDCAKLSVILSKMKFELPQTRTERLTAEQATAIRAKAHEIGRPSIALAQALQFDLKFKQVEVIGEWLPVEDINSPASDLVWNEEKWIRGLRWEEIDDKFILERPVSWREPNGERFKVDLRSYPMVKEELGLINLGSRSGPVVICEWTGQPWKPPEFRRWWRRIADEAGIPKEVKNMDNRPEPARTGRFADFLDSKNSTSNEGDIFN